MGFYTAIITPVIAALWGSSYHLISGPTTASSIVTYATLTNYVHPENDLQTFVALAMVLTFLAGFFKLVMGLLRMGKLVNFVSHSVVIGFTAGAGILIAFKQLKHVFGHDVPQGSSVLDIISYISQHIGQTNWLVFLVAISTLLIAILIKKFIKSIARYNMLIAMFLGTFLALILGGETVGITTVGHVPSHFPPFQIPSLTIDHVQKLSSGALVLALLGLIEAIAIARSIALNSHQRIDANQEFIGQGLSNLVGSFFFKLHQFRFIYPFGSKLPSWCQNTYVSNYCSSFIVVGCVVFCFLRFLFA
jgi:SulP family sulfate permease